MSSIKTSKSESNLAAPLDFTKKMGRTSEGGAVVMSGTAIAELASRGKLPKKCRFLLLPPPHRPALALPAQRPPANHAPNMNSSALSPGIHPNTPPQLSLPSAFVDADQPLSVAQSGVQAPGQTPSVAQNSAQAPNQQPPSVAQIGTKEWTQVDHRGHLSIIAGQVTFDTSYYAPLQITELIDLTPARLHAHPDFDGLLNQLRTMTVMAAWWDDRDELRTKRNATFHWSNLTMKHAREIFGERGGRVTLLNADSAHDEKGNRIGAETDRRTAEATHRQMNAATALALLMRQTGDDVLFGRVVAAAPEEVLADVKKFKPGPFFTAFGINVLLNAVIRKTMAAPVWNDNEKMMDAARDFFVDFLTFFRSQPDIENRSRVLEGLHHGADLGMNEADLSMALMGAFSLEPDNRTAEGAGLLTGLIFASAKTYASALKTRDQRDLDLFYWIMSSLSSGITSAAGLAGPIPGAIGANLSSVSDGIKLVLDRKPRWQPREYGILIDRLLNRYFLSPAAGGEFVPGVIPRGLSRLPDPEMERIAQGEGKKYVKTVQRMMLNMQS